MLFRSMVVVAWQELKALAFHPSEVLERILVRDGLALSLVLGMIGYYGSTLPLSELLLPTAMGGRAYFLLNFPVRAGRMALTVALIHLACRAIVHGRGRWSELVALWGYTQLPGIVLCALALAYFAMVPIAAETGRRGSCG